MCGECIKISGCGYVYCASIPECPTDNVIKVLSKLDETDYMWVITDKFGHQYKDIIEADGNGDFEIDITKLPPQLLTRHSGQFKLQVFKAVEAPCNPEQLNFCNLEQDQVVDTVHFKMYKSDIEETAYIGCICDPIV